MRPLQFGSTITVRLPDDVRELVEAAAEREDADLSSWVRRALAHVATSAVSGGSSLPSPFPAGAAFQAEGRAA